MKLGLTFVAIIALFSCSKNSNGESDATQKARYTLTYNSNGATSGRPPSAVVAPSGSIITLSGGQGMIRHGYIFDGWNTNAAATGIHFAVSGDYRINGNTTLYAKWKRVTSTSNSMIITLGNFRFTATLASNATTEAFETLLPLTLNMSDFNNNEKVCSLPHSLPTAASNPGSIRAGDIMLFGSNSLVVFYENFSTSYSYTRIGQIDDPSGLKSALGKGSVSIKFESK